MQEGSSSIRRASIGRGPHRVPVSTVSRRASTTLRSGPARMAWRRPPDGVGIVLRLAIDELGRDRGGSAGTRPGNPREPTTPVWAAGRHVLPDDGDPLGPVGARP